MVRFRLFKFCVPFQITTVRLFGRDCIGEGGTYSVCVHLSASSGIAVRENVGAICCLSIVSVEPVCVVSQYPRLKPKALR